VKAEGHSMRSASIAALASLLIACSGGSSSPNKCTPGARVACACANGQAGFQVCASDGTLGTCSCDSGTGTGGSGNGGTPGNGGTTGSGGTINTGGTTGSGGTINTGGTTGSGGTTATGGASGLGGATGSGGTVGSGGTGGSTATSTGGQLTITYDGTTTNMYSTCYQCTANYYATPTTDGLLHLSYNHGFETVALDARVVSGGSDNEVSVSLGEQNPALPGPIQGTYVQTPNFVPVAGSCVNFSQLSLQNGGGMAGTLNCTLTGGDDTTPHTAVVQGSFQGTFAP
jgi:hypothetical protein